MPGQVMLDTDVLVDYLRGYQPAMALVQENAEVIVIPAIVVAELYAGVKGEEELAALDRFLGLFPIIPVTGAIARAGGLYSKQYSKSLGTGLADAVIAAAADMTGSHLKTLNVKHFPMYKNLEPAYLKPPSRRN